MTFAILTINNRRPKIFNIWCASMKRLRADIGINFPVVCVSGVEDLRTCATYKIHHITHANKPASRKWDIGMSFIKTLDVDYVIILGSDDIIDTNMLRTMMAEMEQDVDLVGTKEIYVYASDGTHKGELIHFTSGKMLGVGKCVNKRVLDKVNWQPWASTSPRNWGMDALMSRNTNMHIETRSFVSGVIVDVKSTESLNKYTMFVNNHKGVPANVKIFYDILGEEEMFLLNNL